MTDQERTVMYYNPKFHSFTALEPFRLTGITLNDNWEVVSITGTTDYWVDFTQTLPYPEGKDSANCWYPTDQDGNAELPAAITAGEIWNCMMFQDPYLSADDLDDMLSLYGSFQWMAGCDFAKDRSEAYMSKHSSVVRAYIIDRWGGG